MAGLTEAPVRASLPDLHPDLGTAYGWLAGHRHEVVPALAARDPAAASVLRDALERVPRTAASG